MYRAFAPFLEGDRGDRRVTGCTSLERLSDVHYASVGNGLKLCLFRDEDRIALLRVTCEFSRELGANYALSYHKWHVFS